MSVPPLDPNLRDWIETIAWLVAIVGGGLAFIKYISVQRHHQTRRQEELEQHRLDLRWRQADAAKKLIDSLLADSQAWTALRMLDSWSQTFEIAPGRPVVITPDQWITALRFATDTAAPEVDTLVRESFDRLFFHMAMLEHRVGTGLVHFEDVSFPLSYYVAIMRGDRAVYQGYLKRYNLDRAQRFLNRFDEWTKGAAGAADSNAR